MSNTSQNKSKLDVLNDLKKKEEEKNKFIPVIIPPKPEPQPEPEPEFKIQEPSIKKEDSIEKNRSMSKPSIDKNYELKEEPRPFRMKSNNPSQFSRKPSKSIHEKEMADSNGPSYYGTNH